MLDAGEADHYQNLTAPNVVVPTTCEKIDISVVAVDANVNNK